MLKCPPWGSTVQSKAGAIVNFGNEEGDAQVMWPGGEGQSVVILKPFRPDAVDKLPVTIRLAPRTCAVVVKA